MATTEFIPFSTSGTANVYTNAEYVADPDQANGNQPNSAAKSKLVNKALRQSSIVSAVVTQYIADITGNNSVDDGTTTTLLADLKNAVSANNTIGTIAALRLTPYSGQQIVSVTGYYTAADNIGVREYYWDAVSIEADNGGTIIQVTGVVTGRWKMKYSGAVNVKWFGAIVNTDITTVSQTAVNYCSPLGIELKFSDEYIITTVNIPVTGINIDLTGSYITINSGTGFTQEIIQVLNTTYYASNSPLDSNGTYFYPIIINGGRVTLNNGAMFCSVRRPFLYANGFDYYALTVKNTQIVMNNTARAFGIHGGWGFLLDGVNVTGDWVSGNNTFTNYAIYMRPDGTHFVSSHAQLINIVNCKFDKCGVFDTDNGLCTNSCEALNITSTTMAFVDAGILKIANAVTITGGLYVIYGDFIFNLCSQISISGCYLQRETGNVSPSGYSYGAVTFVGGASSIKINNIQSTMASSTGIISTNVISIIGESASNYYSITISDIMCTRVAMTDVNEINPQVQTSVIRIIQRDTSQFYNINIDNISARSTHNIIDMSEVFNIALIDFIKIGIIKNIGIEVKKRVKSITNAAIIVSPSMYFTSLVNIYGVSTGSTVADNVASQFISLPEMRGTKTTVISSFNSISNALAITNLGSSINGNNFALQQITGLAAGIKVQAYATITINTSESLV